jgi:hypothetical protein
LRRSPSRLYLRGSAIDKQLDPGDETGIPGGQEECGRRDLVRLSVIAPRVLRAILIGPSNEQTGRGRELPEGPAMKTRSNTTAWLKLVVLDGDRDVVARATTGRSGDRGSRASKRSRRGHGVGGGRRRRLYFRPRRQYDARCAGGKTADNLRFHHANCAPLAGFLRNTKIRIRALRVP